MASGNGLKVKGSKVTTARSASISPSQLVTPRNDGSTVEERDRDTSVRGWSRFGFGGTWDCGFLHTLIPVITVSVTPLTPMIMDPVTSVFMGFSYSPWLPCPLSP